MNVMEPAAALGGLLAIGILRALSRRSVPMSAAQIVRASDHGTAAGVRRALQRLSNEGLVRTELLGDLAMYSLNYDHVLYRAVEVLLDTRLELARRLRAEIGGWDQAPAFAGLYGSAARFDGDGESDVDLLLIRPYLPTSARQRWITQVRRLRTSVYEWTGNNADVTDLTAAQFNRRAAGNPVLVDEWRDDLVTLAGDAPNRLLMAQR